MLQTGCRLLPETDDPVEDQQRHDDDKIIPVLHQGGEDRGNLDHPGNRSPEVPQEL